MITCGVRRRRRLRRVVTDVGRWRAQLRLKWTTSPSSGVKVMVCVCPKRRPGGSSDMLFSMESTRASPSALQRDPATQPWIKFTKFDCGEMSKSFDAALRGAN